MVDVEGILHDWGERWDWSYHNAEKNKLIGGSSRLRARFNSITVGSRSVRSALNAIVRRTPQAVIKITGGGRGTRAMAVHLKYISRGGEVELLDEQGMTVRGSDEVEALSRSMEFGGGDVVPAVSPRREAFNIVFSMPPGTDRFQFRRAANDFIQAQFEGCQYAVAHHDDEAHPHCHLMVKAVRLDGRRLNPRKADLATWRAGFAAMLRSHGIEADATPRQARLACATGVTQERVHRQERAATAPRRVKGGLAAETRRKQLKAVEGQAVATHRRAVRDLWAVHAALKSTNKGSDFALAREISKMLRREGHFYDYQYERTKALAVGLERGQEAGRLGADRLRGLSPRDVAPGARAGQAGGVLQADAPRNVQR